MILQRLHDYYQRLLADGLAQPTGFQDKEIHFVVTLDAEGRFIALRSTRDEKGRGKTFVVPAEVIKAAGIKANLLWDNAEYVFGLARPGLTEKQAAKVPERHAAFLARLKALPEDAKADAGLAAVLTYLSAGDWSAMATADSWDELRAGGANVSFRLEGDPGLVCGRPGLRGALMGAESAAEASAWCLVTGQAAIPARLHPNIKNVPGASKPVSLVAINTLENPAFGSHGWTQGYNAPVSVAAAHAYASALSFLLAREQDRHHHVEGDATYVFWATGPTPLEESFLSLITGGAFQDEESGEIPDGQKVLDVFAAIRKALRKLDTDSTPFCILGLAPNAARLAVFFWHQGTVEAIARSIGRHFDDLDVDGLWDKGKAPGLWHLLSAAAKGGDVGTFSDQLRRALSKDLVAAILKETPYPATLLARTIHRCQAEQGVWPIRAAVIKASLNRNTRLRADNQREITVGLDDDNTNAGYLLGRLFALYEAVQRSSQGGTKSNVTIRDRYFSAAMTAPRSVYPQLERLNAAHRRKFRGGFPRRFGDPLQRVFHLMDADRAYPATLSLEDQGRFVLGYHHQSHRLWERAEADPQDTITTESEA
ncbi:type I-C CRISPR-associated protein Cas8c/Csd1 [Magnetospirillum sp. UT-4]|uniref:type I-C CRISPR-associated protein Cas8c/Csd1 n=1 Tax=Magnetospirillum sp. UT-4 TaxID=2681467 RepID=UPI001381FB35|nr:type I-C CRISPR-associated protein Cas8c/Csd1 [Magnetospirillum sp. UT-4]CAA7622826.1 putative CRISPR-associated protein, Csd1 family [Magnetospirillum sp. UT-4]